MHYAVIKHNRHLRTRGKRRKHKLQASVFYISQVFSNVWSVKSQCSTHLRLLRLLYDIKETVTKNNKTHFPMFYTLIRDCLLTNHGTHRVLCIF